MNNFFQFFQEIIMSDLKDNSILKNEDYKDFINEWEKLSKNIYELKKKYEKDYTSDKKREIKQNQKEYNEFLEREKQIKSFLNGTCFNCLNTNVPIIREMEKKKATEFQEICNRFKKIMKKNNEENLENSYSELKNSVYFDIYQEIKDVCNKQNNKLKIQNLDDYIEELKEKLLKIDFGQDNLIQTVQLSLDNYFKNEEEINNSLTNKSYSDNSIDSLKEIQLENEGKYKKNKTDNNDNYSINNNIIKTNNNDISSLNSTSINGRNSGIIFKKKIQSKDISLNNEQKKKF